MTSRVGSSALPTANRPMAKPSRTRYFKGKAPDAAPTDSDESDDDDEANDEQLRRQKARAKKAALAAAEAEKRANLVAGGAGRIIRQGDAKAAGQLKMELGDVKVGGKAAPIKREVQAKEEEESSSGEEETDDEDEAEVKPPRVGLPQPAGGESSSEYETDSEEESEEEKKPAFRPVFVRKDQRGMTQEKAAKLAEEKAAKEEELEAQRKLDSKELAGETIRRELAEKEVVGLIPDVDDTDGHDPAGEFDAWRARELARLLRDKQAQAARDEEQEEIERRRAMPEEQRLREDMEYADQTRAREKTQMGFLQKYYHKGAFHQDDDLLQRDYTGATQSQVDMSMLPKVMQVRDFGKTSRTKYTHLTDQDTTGGGWGTAARSGPGAGGGIGSIGTTDTGCWNCGGPHMRKDCPNQNINDPLVAAGVPGYGGAAGFNSGGGGAGTSANSAPLGYGGSSSRGDRFGGDRTAGGYRGDQDRGHGRESSSSRDNGYASRNRRETEHGDGYGRDRNGPYSGRDRDDLGNSRGGRREEEYVRRDRYREDDRDDHRYSRDNDRRRRDDRDDDRRRGGDDRDHERRERNDRRDGRTRESDRDDRGKDRDSDRRR